MQKIWMKAGLAALLCLGCVAGAMAVEVPTAEWESMKQKIAELQARGEAIPATSTMVDVAMDSKYGPNTPATTFKAPGKLQIGLLTQIWYYDIQRDNRGFFSDPGGNAIADNNLSNDINSFRIRRTELKFVYDLNECVGVTLMFDPAREAAGFPQFPSNQGDFKKSPTGNGQFSAGTSTTITGGLTGGLNGTAGAGVPARLLQDSYITFKNIIPYVEMKVGQFKAKCGEEGVRDSANLDFAERSMIGFQGDNRDLGAGAHASFWGKDCKDMDGRFQVWAGTFDGAGSFYNPGNEQNRNDNNQSKDFNAAFLVRPLWDDCWGKFEVGASYYGGRHGAQSIDTSAYAAVTATTPIVPQCYASKGNVWFSYKFGKWLDTGLWVRGEYGFIRDHQEGSEIAFGNGNLGTGAALGFSQTALQPFTSQGGYAALGYRFGEASWVQCMPCWLKDFELAARYDQFQNIETANLGNPNRTSVFSTHAATAGLNYYFGERTKIQVNYNYVDLPTEKTNGTRNFHDTQNNSLLINFQVAF